MKLRFLILTALFFGAFLHFASAAQFDNENGFYSLSPLPSAVSEATRMDRMKLCDQQPAGLYVRKGDLLTFDVDEIPEGAELSVHIGFRPMWNVAQDQQKKRLPVGTARLVANQNGPVFFRYISPRKNEKEVEIQVSGGTALPLFVSAEMSAQDWQQELERHADAPFVQLFDDKAMITLPMKTYLRNPIADPAQSLAMVDNVIDLQNQLAGFDGSTTLNMPSPLRQHYLEDFRVSKKDREDFYMYATNEFIGLLNDNASDLTDPAELKTKWGIWHETGHVHQQNSWTWNSLTEINVNIFSLYVQEKFGQPNRLSESDDQGKTTFQKARRYLAKGKHNYLVEGTDYDEYFIKLVMFHQLRKAYGWEIFTKLFRHYRAQPLAIDASDQDKADGFVINLSEIAGEDLRPFFNKWGLGISRKANAILDDKAYPEPERDLASVFE
jgi:Peptidase M60, enhancin and enhancin-like